MMMPSIFGESLFDEMMNFPFEREFFGRSNPQYGKSQNHIMKTDVKEIEGGYELDMDLPGYKKEDISVKLEKGYLTVSAVKNVNNDRKDENGKYIRQERYSGSCSRSFYVGENVSQEDIHGKFEDGILKLTLPKEDQKKVETSKYIAIEG